MTLVNAVGETVLDQRVQVKSGANSIELDLSFLVSGHYQFLLESSEFASSASIIHYAE